MRISRSRSQASADCRFAKIVQRRGLGGGGQELLRAHVEQLGGRGQVRAVIAVGAEHSVVDIHLLGEAVEGGARRMHARRDALAIVGAQPLVAAGNVENRRIELPAEGCWKRFAEPFQSGRGRSILEGNHDQGAADDAADYVRPEAVASWARSAAQKSSETSNDENSGAFHDKSDYIGRETAVSRAPLAGGDRWLSGSICVGCGLATSATGSSPADRRCR